MKYNQNNKKYNINERYFSQWSNNMAYILGYIYADGNLDKSKFRVRISSIDKSILEEINKELESNREIRLESNSLGSWYTLYIDNMFIYKDLENLGLTPSKSFTCNIKGIPEVFKYDFIRGYFDGDGCVYSKKHKDSKPTLSVDIATASTEFKDTFIDLTSDIVSEKGRFSIQTRSNGLHIIRANSKVSEKLYSKMYYKNCLCLTRKKDKFEEILKLRHKEEMIID